ncbi:MAG: alpha-L-fucosidase [Bacteroidales bacterium]|nr:alpha-L-fucosidase [Bacteroidales bacterium]
MFRKVLLLSMLSLLSLGIFAQSDQYPETDPVITHRISEWQDLKFGFMMHWGMYAQWEVV